MHFAVQAIRPFTPQPLPSFHQWTLPNGTIWVQFYRTNSGYVLRFPDLAEFEISADGQTISCWPSAEISDSTIQHLYLNQVLPLALSQQGQLVFHASAVEIGDVAVAFMGASGRGKSTLATGFATNGFRFLTDDGLILEPCEGHYQVKPSHPSIRLWQDSEQALVSADVVKAPPVQFTAKSRFLSGQGISFCEQPRPLKQVYFLGEGKTEQFVCKRIPAATAFIELLKHSFILDIEATTFLANQFDTLSHLTQRIPCYHLDYPRSFARLAAVRQAVVDHVTNED